MTHILGDGFVGVHRVNYDSVDPVVLCSYLILSLSMKNLLARVIELRSMLETMFRLYAYSVGTH